MLIRNNLKRHVTRIVHGFGANCYILMTNKSCFVHIRSAKKEVGIIVSETKVVQWNLDNSNSDNSNSPLTRSKFPFP